MAGGSRKPEHESGDGPSSSEAHVSNEGGASPPAGRRRRGLSGLTGFGLGFAAAAVLGAAGKPLGRALRPVLRTTIKGGIRTGRWLSQVAEQTREHLEDVVAEARHEMGEEAEPSLTGHAKPHDHSHSPTRG